jgi:hypothetical protein
MDSYRAEAYGFFYCHSSRLMSKFFYSPLPPNLVRQPLSGANHQLNHYPSPPCVPSTELGHYPSNLSDLPSSSFTLFATFEGPSDRTTKFWNLPLEAQLNVQADKLATAFQEESSHGTDRGPMIPGSGCQLVMENQVISSNHRRRNRTRRGKEKLMTYIQEKLQIRAEELSNIDWESHSKAIRSVKIPNRSFVIKFLHRWLPVGKRVHQYSPSIYPDHCPSCIFPIEDFDCTFRCPRPQRR